MNLYHYRVDGVTDIYDGDTVTLVIDLGFDTYRQMKLRLYGIDTPEMRGAEREQGVYVRGLVEDIFNHAQSIRIRSIKDRTGKYGRYLAVIYITDESGNDLNLNQYLLDNGLAKPFMIDDDDPYLTVPKED